MRILGFQKLTLLDYPGKVACTVFIGGCNFRCPFCHNADLVLNPNVQPAIPEEKVFETLKKRQGILEGVCITGGEPTIFPELKNFLKKIKERGFAIKLDTNGYKPEMIAELVKEDLIDYVAMDIKNSPLKYAETVGLGELDITQIQKSIDFLKQGSIDYEFRTTIVRELHTPEDVHKIARWLSGCKRYFLQSYQESKRVINPIFTSYDKAELEQLRDAIIAHVPNVEIRGV